MTFNNAINGSNTDFELSSGTFQFANRVRLNGGYAENIGIAYNAGTGTFTVQGAAGAALSATNPGYINLASKTNPGQQIKISITANQTFIDDNGASTIIGNLFGLTTGIAFAQDIPFWIYAVCSDNERDISFMISRYPGANTSPAAAKIGKTGSAIADTQGSFFALGNPTVADFESNPCINIGSIRMRMSAADDWTVQTLANGDGIGKFQFGVSFTMATGQFGAASGKYFKDNGGTAPAFTANAFQYYFTDLSGFFSYYCTFVNASTAGVGAVTLLLALPYIVAGGVNGTGFTSTANPTNVILLHLNTATTNSIDFIGPQANIVFLNSTIILTVNMDFSGRINLIYT